MTSDVCYAKKIKYNVLHNCLNTNYAICPDTDLNCSIKTSPTPLILTLLWQRMLWKGQVNSLCKLQLFLYVVKIMSQYQSLRFSPSPSLVLLKAELSIPGRGAAPTFHLLQGNGFPSNCWCWSSCGRLAAFTQGKTRIVWFLWLKPQPNSIQGICIKPL